MKPLEFDVQRKENYKSNYSKMQTTTPKPCRKRRQTIKAEEFFNSLNKKKRPNEKESEIQIEIPKKVEKKKTKQIFVPVARPKSTRKTKSVVAMERRLKIEEAVRTANEEGVQARVIESKGRGIFASKTFQRKDYIVEYAGDLIKPNEAHYREKFYASKDESGSSYMFYFKHNDEILW
jgi:hypothetical protein